MIIMRALVGTVLLIAVMLVSIVLINANTRPVRGASSTSKEVSVKEKSSAGSKYDQQPQIEIEVDESFENVKVGDGGVGARVVEKESEEPAQEEKEGRLISAIKKSGKEVVAPTAVLVEIARDGDSDEELVEGLSEGVVEEVLFTDGFTVDSESHEDATDASRNDTTAETEQKKQMSVEDDAGEIEIIEVETEGKPEGTRLEPKPVQESKTRSKESRVIPTTESQPASAPMGYDPSSYIIMDEEPLIEVSKDSDSEDEELDPKESETGSKVLERKQRHADGCPETIILNKVPIIPYIKDEYKRSSPHRFPPLKSSRLAKRDLSAHRDLDHAQKGHHHHHHHHHHQPQQAILNPSVYNPYNWEKQNMNELRFPQCAACQKKSVPVCRTCGQCADCCHKSGCTCGCLHP